MPPLQESAHLSDSSVSYINGFRPIDAASPQLYGPNVYIPTTNTHLQYGAYPHPPRPPVLPFHGPSPSVRSLDSFIPPPQWQAGYPGNDECLEAYSSEARTPFERPQYPIQGHNVAEHGRGSLMAHHPQSQQALPENVVPGFAEQNIGNGLAGIEDRVSQELATEKKANLEGRKVTTVSGLQSRSR